MIELKNIVREYITGDLKQRALNGINLKFRKNEFVSILGQSGSGKTTLLNIIGGLDQPDEGEILIDGKTTSKYRDRDWDAYRNNSVGFVFQNYNLISHQSILKNVELALTLSGVSSKESKERARKALERVGLSQHVNKKPNQLSGGQMQRVAIARALVNDPDILLADEPTGALDSETSVQIMDLLKEIARDRLVIMVTHNPELAKEYSTRIVELRDGEIISDSNPWSDESDGDAGALVQKKTKMSFLTALGLSFNNLLTKKGRTLLTAFAGSIGIIGIALILSLSTGVNEYIANIQEDTLASFPLTVERKAQDLNKLMKGKEDKSGREEGYAYVNDRMTKLVTTEVKENDLKAFKSYLDENREKYSSSINDIQYSYDIKMMIFKSDSNQSVLPSILDKKLQEKTSGNNGQVRSFGQRNSNNWKELIDNKELLEKQYQILEGKFPESPDEAIILLNKDGEVSEQLLYSLGLRNEEDLQKLFPEESSTKSDTSADLESEANKDEEKIKLSSFIGLEYRIVPDAELFVKDGEIFKDKSKDENFIKSLIKDGVKVKIAGVAKPKKTTQGVGETSFIGYNRSLSNDLIKRINNSEAVKAQNEDKKTNIFTGKAFPEKKQKEQFSFESLSEEDKLKFSKMKPEEITEYVNNYNDNVNANLEDNLKKIGAIDTENPISIGFYPKSFAAKEEIKKDIDAYNAKYQEGENKDLSRVITYTDQVGILMNSITNIVNIITYVLIAFVAISLVVSSIMIAIITYISVLERTKEIGILRAIGASKKDITRVFTAETFIEGLLAGVMGIVVTLLLNIPVNRIIAKLTNTENLSILPWRWALILILISIVLTVIAGIIPSRIASKKDPIEALRTE